MACAGGSAARKRSTAPATAENIISVTCSLSANGLRPRSGALGTAAPPPLPRAPAANHRSLRITWHLTLQV